METKLLSRKYEISWVNNFKIINSLDTKFSENTVLLLTLNVFDTFFIVSIVDFEQVNVSLEISAWWKCIIVYTVCKTFHFVIIFIYRRY